MIEDRGEWLFSDMFVKTKRRSVFFVKMLTRQGIFKKAQTQNFSNRFFLYMYFDIVFEREFNKTFVAAEFEALSLLLYGHSPRVFDPRSTPAVNQLAVEKLRVAFQIGGVEVHHGSVVFGHTQHATTDHLKFKKPKFKQRTKKKKETTTANMSRIICCS